VAVVTGGSGCEMGGCKTIWGVQGRVDGKRGGSLGICDVVSDTAGVRDSAGDDTAHFGGLWGGLGVW
jgi:hypothetical protein